jgi:hypothetical protein
MADNDRLRLFSLAVATPEYYSISLADESGTLTLVT